MSQSTIADNQTHELPAGSVVTCWNDKSMINSEASTELAFGRMVQFGTSDNLMLALAGAAATDLAGILALTHLVPGSQLGETGLEPDQVGRVVRHGVIWVYSETGNAPSDAVRVRHTVDTGKFIGDFTKTADAGKTFAITGAKWLKTTTGAGLTLLEINMSALTASADV